MGLENNSNAKFLSIGDGKITKRVKEPTEKSVTRTTKEGKIVHEEIYDAISGLLVDIKTTDHPQYGRFWNITLSDGEENFILQMNYSSGYSSAFLKILPNVDLTSPIRIIPSMKIVEGKKKTSLFISQHGDALKHAYTRDKPNGLPELQKVKIKKNGKMTEAWDDNDMMEFLENMVVEQIQPQLKRSTPVKAEATINKTATVSADEEDAPF